MNNLLQRERIARLRQTPLGSRDSLSMLFSDQAEEAIEQGEQAVFCREGVYISLA